MGSIRPNWLKHVPKASKNVFILKNGSNRCIIDKKRLNYLLIRKKTINKNTFSPIERNFLFIDRNFFFIDTFFSL